MMTVINHIHHNDSFWKKVIDKENATYVTEKFKINEIEDLHYNKFDNIDKLSPSKINIFDKTNKSHVIRK